eukprot:scpid32491/ scgid32985/ 
MRNLNSRTEEKFSVDDMATSDVTTRADPLSPGCRGLANPRPESFHSRAPAARKVVLSLGTWNVRTLVDTDGNLNTASKAKSVVSSKSMEWTSLASRRRFGLALINILSEIA